MLLIAAETPWSIFYWQNVIKKYIPYYTCDVLLQPITRLGLKYSFYPINEKFEAVFDFNSIKKHEAFVYTNYYGLKDNYINSISIKCKNLIIDNAQAFYSQPLKNVDVFYSPRKFFGVPDGGFLYTKTRLDKNFERDISLGRVGHLLGKIENSSEESFNLFIQNDKSLIGQPIKLMSNLTQTLLKNINYKNTAKIRRDNFNQLHQSTVYSFEFIIIS